jgi:hypothetical protein
LLVDLFSDWTARRQLLVRIRRKGALGRYLGHVARFIGG